MLIIGLLTVYCGREAIYSVLFVAGKPTLELDEVPALAGFSFRTTDVSDVFEAMSKASRERPDIIIMNVDLPMMDGWEACHWLRQTFGVPVILLGREVGGNAWSKAVQAGADCYLAAPFSNLELSARVKAILRRYGEI